MGTRSSRGTVTCFERDYGSDHSEPDRRCSPEVSARAVGKPTLASQVTFLRVPACREQDWHLRYRKDGQTPYFVSERKSASLKSSPGSTLGRPTATPSPCSTPVTQPAPYASSIRSTHIAGDDLPHTDSPTGSTNLTTSALSSDAAALMASRPPGTASFSASPQPMESAPNSNVGAAVGGLPQLSATDYSFPIGQDGLNFNPALNMPGSAQFDPFGVGVDGTPQLFPTDGIFDWGQSWLED